ncbi:MAG TPA: hypothetical protein PLJ71_10975 [Candidatus Hydrogenedentes bacterium]|nr:hypothetical protein [Candidatus Hydrogenedentota bacterium]HQM49202.1 hypothetical protein [Candidatus Hydrogenedentota bacterium]
MDGYLARRDLLIGMVKVLRDVLKADDPPDAYGVGYTALAWTHDGQTRVRNLPTSSTQIRRKPPGITPMPGSTGRFLLTTKSTSITAAAPVAARSTGSRNARLAR